MYLIRLQLKEESCNESRAYDSYKQGRFIIRVDTQLKAEMKN